MGVVVPQASVGTGRSPEPPQKFGHGDLFVGQLLSRNQVTQKIRAIPPPPLNRVILHTPRGPVNRGFTLLHFDLYDDYSFFQSS